MCNNLSLSPFHLPQLPRSAGQSAKAGWLVRALCISALLLLTSLAWTATALANDFSWTARVVSPAIARQGLAIPTLYLPGKAINRIPAGSTITQVYANRSYSSDALVQTQLCWNGTLRCVELTGQHLNTQAFNGLDPSKPMYLVHKVISWGPSFPPLFVTGNVNVWFTPPVSLP